MSSNALLWPSQGTIPERMLDKYKWLRLPSQGFGGMIVGDPLLAIFPPIADATFQFYRFYQVKKGQVPTTQINMPLLITDTLGTGILQEASGFDIRAFDAAGSPLPYEVQSVNITTGEIIVWINVTTVQDNEFIQLTFGKPSAINGQTSTTWPSEYKGVWHLDGDLLDSTSNGNNGTAQGTPGPTSTLGKIGNALRFDGIDDGVDVGNGASLNITGNKLSLSAWMNPDDKNNFESLLGKSRDQGFGWVLFNNGGFAHCRIDGDAVSSATADIVTGALQKMNATYDGVNLKVYYNGVLSGTLAKTSNIGATTQPAAIGFSLDLTLSEFFAGIIDEPRIILGVIHDADYIKTQFNNENDNNAFWFKTPTLENGVDNFLVDDQGRRLVAVGQ